MGDLPAEQALEVLRDTETDKFGFKKTLSILTRKNFSFTEFSTKLH